MKLSKKEIELINSSKIIDCAKQCIARRDRDEHPAGSFDNAKRWYPDSSEFFDESSFRTPSRSYPFSYMTACRSVKHVCNLHDITDKKEILAVKRCIKLIDADELI